MPDQGEKISRALQRIEALQAFLAAYRGFPGRSYALSLCDEVLEALYGDDPPYPKNPSRN